MSRIVLVRHGQTAGFMTGTYNTLTPLGRDQAAAVGQSWAARGWTPDRILCGPQPRHQETLQIARAAAGGEWPAAEAAPAFDEHAGAHVALSAIPQLAAANHPLALRMTQGETLSGRERAGLFRAAMEAWVAGRVRVPDQESFDAFQARVENGLRTLAAALKPDEDVAVFTSAGSIAASSAGVLEGSPMATMRLSWSVLNASMTTFRVSRGGHPMVLHFNVIAHLSADLHSFL